MTRLFVIPGWIGFRYRSQQAGFGYVVLRDVTRHRLLYSERNNTSRSRRVLKLGRWEVWLKP